jgi:hypothetical protein
LPGDELSLNDTVQIRTRCIVTTRRSGTRVSWTQRHDKISET